MNARRLSPLALVVLALACTPPSSPPTPTEAGADSFGPLGIHPPAPPTPRALDPDLAAQLPHTDDGRPILLGTGAPGPDGYEIQLVYDETIDDPISRWGQCLSRIVSCYEENPGGGPIAGCIALVERCDSDAGGEGCCPPACFTAFDAALAAGTAESDAVDDVFVEGACVEGLSELRAAAEAEIP